MLYPQCQKSLCISVFLLLMARQVCSYGRNHDLASALVHKVNYETPTIPVLANENSSAQLSEVFNGSSSSIIFSISNKTLEGIPGLFHNHTHEEATLDQPNDEASLEARGVALAMLVGAIVASTIYCILMGQSIKNQNQKKNSLCLFAGIAGARNKSKRHREQKSLCPFAAKGRRKPNKRTILKQLGARPFTLFAEKFPSSRTTGWIINEVQRDHTTVTTTKTFWELYQVIANEHTGLFGDSMGGGGDGDESSLTILAKAPKLRAMVAVSEHESAERYARCHADEYRTWLAWRLADIDASLDGDKDLNAELDSLNRSELKLVLGACVYLRHSWHQGNPNVEPVPTTQPTDSHGHVVGEPTQLKIAVEFVANRLGVTPYFNVYSWLFCNWKWIPATASATAKPSDNPLSKLLIGNVIVKGGDDSLGSLTYEKICDLTVGSMSPRFYWLTGAARESEANFWRAFAYSEFMAVPLYGEVGKLMDEANAYKNANAQQGPSSESIANVLQSLEKVQDVTRNITAALVAYGTPELIDAQHFIQMQYTAHYAGTTAGASGFQAPCMVLLDTLLGVDFTALSTELQQTRHENIDEMLPEVVSIIFGIVRPGSQALRQFIDSIACRVQRELVQTAFNGVAEELILWRSSHRARAGKYIEASTVTTGRTNEDMGGNVHSTFLQEMNSIITATKATRFTVNS